MKHSRLLFKLASVIFLLIGGSVCQTAYANSITVNFTVTADTSDFLNAGKSAQGTFSFDNGLIPAGGGRLFSFGGLGANSITFTWDGTDWNRDTADVLELIFDSDGALNGWGLGGAVSGYQSISSSAFPDIFIVAHATPLFLYSDSRTAARGLFSGNLSSWSVSGATVAEPESWITLLSGLGIVFLGFRYFTISKPTRT